jgi:hypothetical protein
MAPGTDEQAQALGMSSADLVEASEAAIAGGVIELPVDVLLRISAILGIHKAARHPVRSARQAGLAQ